MTYQQFAELAGEMFGQTTSYRVLLRWLLSTVGLFSKQVGELKELLPRYTQDNLFGSSKFKRRFPDFQVTNYSQWLGQIFREAKAS